MDSCDLHNEKGLLGLLTETKYVSTGTVVNAVAGYVAGRLGTNPVTAILFTLAVDWYFQNALRCQYPQFFGGKSTLRMNIAARLIAYYIGHADYLNRHPEARFTPFLPSWITGVPDVPVQPQQTIAYVPMPTM